MNWLLSNNLITFEPLDIYPYALNKINKLTLLYNRIMSEYKKIGVVIVSYGHEKEISRLIKTFQNQLKTNDKLVVVDNKKPYQFSKLLKNGLRIDHIINHDNGGFAVGCNIGAGKIIKDVNILFFLNPDVYVEDSNLIEKIRKAADDGYAAWMPLLVLPDGRINSAGNVIHFSGLSWCDHYLENTSDISSSDFEINSVSGACMAIDVKWWNKIGGFNENYFMYHEDLDLSTRLLLAGGKLGCIPAAKIIHDYDFEKGNYKWLYIERNRILYILINWHLSILILITPFLLMINLAILTQYLIKGRLWLKIKADLGVFKCMPWAIKNRQDIKKIRKIKASTLFGKLSYRLSSPALGVIANKKIIDYILGIYYGLVKFIIILFRR